MRPFISFLTDFGPDSAAAICRGVMLSIARDAQIVDISHSVRKYAIRDGAFLLSASLPWMPVGVHVGVVDPGVGTARRPIGILTGRGDVLIGPDNGLLFPAAQQLGGIRRASGSGLDLPPQDVRLEVWRLPCDQGRPDGGPHAGRVLALGPGKLGMEEGADPGDLARRRLVWLVHARDRLVVSVEHAPGARQGGLGRGLVALGPSPDRDVRGRPESEHREGPDDPRVDSALDPRVAIVDGLEG